jgi:hypothetical protein
LGVVGVGGAGSPMDTLAAQSPGRVDDVVRLGPEAEAVGSGVVGDIPGSSSIVAMVGATTIVEGPPVDIVVDVFTRPLPVPYHRPPIIRYDANTSPLLSGEFVSAVAHGEVEVDVRTEAGTEDGSVVGAGVASLSESAAIDVRTGSDVVDAAEAGAAGTSGELFSGHVSAEGVSAVVPMSDQGVSGGTLEGITVHLCTSRVGNESVGETGGFLGVAVLPGTSRDLGDGPVGVGRIPHLQPVQRAPITSWESRAARCQQAELDEQQYVQSRTEFHPSPDVRRRRAAAAATSCRSRRAEYAVRRQQRIRNALRLEDILSRTENLLADPRVRAALEAQYPTLVAEMRWLDEGNLGIPPPDATPASLRRRRQ